MLLAMIDLETFNDWVPVGTHDGMDLFVRRNPYGGTYAAAKQDGQFVEQAYVLVGPKAAVRTLKRKLKKKRAQALRYLRQVSSLRERNQ